MFKRKRKKPKVMTNEEMARFIAMCSKVDTGVRAALIEMGYDESWVEGEFRTAFEAYHHMTHDGL